MLYFLIRAYGDIGDEIPRIPSQSVSLNVGAAGGQIRIHRGGKVPLDCLRQVRRIGRPADQSCFALQYLFAKGSYIRGDRRKSEAIAQEQHATLIDIRVRKNKRVRSLEIYLCIIVRNIRQLPAVLSRIGTVLMRLRDIRPVLLVLFLRLAGYDQAIPALATTAAQCFDQVFQAFVGLDSPEEKNRAFGVPEAELPFRFRRS